MDDSGWILFKCLFFPALISYNYFINDKGHDTIQKLIVLFEFFWVKKWKEKKMIVKKLN